MFKWLKEFWNDWFALDDLELLDEAYMEYYRNGPTHKGDYPDA